MESTVKLIMANSSSDEEDLSKFEAAIDTSFLKLLKNPDEQAIEKPKSERYLEISSHYNDVKVPEQMQKRIGAKLSAVIEKNVLFVDVPTQVVKIPKTKGGVKLFRTSSDFLSCEDVKDTETELHNIRCRKSKKKKRRLESEDNINEDEKIEAAAVTGDYILSKEETLCWKSRRRAKLFKYKATNSGHLVAID